MIASVSLHTLREATVPPEYRGVERDEVRLLITDRATGTHTHALFRDLPAFLRPGDLLVANDSATVPAALGAQRDDGTPVRLHVATMIGDMLWMVEPRVPITAGERMRLPDGACVVMIAPVDPQRPRLWYASFELPTSMHAYLATYGEPIRYGYIARRFPLHDYQTIFARYPGSAEMPSAARPFTQRVLDALAARGVETATVTLHCGVASFETPERPGIERYAVSPQTARAVNRAHRDGGRVLAIGTTTLRALESARVGREIVASSGWTDLVIDRNHAVTSVSGLLTGFHDIAATHQWILEAFLEPQQIRDAYAQAAGHGYYRHEFGDVHLIR